VVRALVRTNRQWSWLWSFIVLRGCDGLPEHRNRRLFARCILSISASSPDERSEIRDIPLECSSSTIRLTRPSEAASSAPKVRPLNKSLSRFAQRELVSEEGRRPSNLGVLGLSLVESRQSMSVARRGCLSTFCSNPQPSQRMVTVSSTLIADRSDYALMPGRSSGTFSMG